MTHPAPLTDQIADEAKPPRLPCPDCGAMVTFHVERDEIVLDWHRARDKFGVWSECTPEKNEAKQ